MAEKLIKVKLSFEPKQVVYEATLIGGTKSGEAVMKVYEALAQDPGKTDLATRLDTILKSSEGYTLRKVTEEEGEVTTETLEPGTPIFEVAKDGVLEMSPIEGEEPGYLPK
jgi:hypothetical protein